MNRHTYQQGHIEAVRTRHGEGFKIKWRVYDANGTWHWKAETLYGVTKKEAKAIKAERIRESSKQAQQPTDLTLRKFVEVQWKPYLKQQNIKQSTIYGYVSALERHILPVLGDMKLDEITPVDIGSVLKSKTVEPLSSKTIRNIVLLMQGIFAYALDQDAVTRSPVRKSHKPALTQINKTAWTDEQVQQILAGVPAAYFALFVVAALTGIRQGELFGLTWENVDLANGELTIAKALWRGELQLPKSNSSRVIPFAAVLHSVLVWHKQLSEKTRPDDFVFCKSDGSALNSDVVRRDVLYPVLDRLNIPRSKRESGFHAFRHAAATFINSQTGNLKLAQELLGHADVGTTANIYTHPTTQAQREAVAVIERLLFPGGLFPNGSRMGTKDNAVSVN
jgi:integrase